MDLNLTINGQPVTVPKGTKILEAAKKANVHIPTLCEHPDLCRRAVCRICVVECDGNTKLAAACANDVWDGMNIVTNNRRILDARKTILELILANHPQNCLTCARNKNCKLQTLAAEFHIGASSFDSNTDSAVMGKLPVIEGKALVRDMDKCVKCVCCVEACQTVQEIGAINTSGRGGEFEICSPYGQALAEGPCVFCGMCASVCPVGAIYEYDQCAEVWKSLDDGGRRTIAQCSASLAELLNREFGYEAGTITAGKMVAAIKSLGIAKVYDSKITAAAADSGLYGELMQRIQGGGILPLISGCGVGVLRFINHFYPDLAAHLAAARSKQRMFTETIKGLYAGEHKLDASNVTSVYFLPCIALKFRDKTAADRGSDDFALGPGELARMIKMAGIDIAALQEEPFDTINIEESSLADRHWCNLESVSINPAQKKIVHSFAQAREVMEEIRKNECSAQWVEIRSCLDSDC